MKVFLQAYLNNNLGDDLMIDFVCKRYKMHDFYISNPNNLNQIACPNKNLHVMRSITPRREQLLFRGFDKTISYLRIPKLGILYHFLTNHYDVNLELGGSIFMQVTPKSWINKVRDAKYICKKCKKNIIVDCNFGPYQSNSFILAHQRLFKMYDFISWRDKYSRKLFYQSDNMDYYPDLILNYKIDKKRNRKKKIGISVIALDNVGIKNNKALYIDGIVRLIENISDIYEISLLAFCENEGDLDTCKQICEKFTDNKIKIFCHNNVCETLDYISGLSGLVCTRFHASIIAVNMGIPFFPIIYSKKTSNMLNDLEYSGYSWDIMSGNEINIDMAIKQLYSDVYVDENKKGEAEGHLEILDEYLSV